MPQDFFADTSPSIAANTKINKTNIKTHALFPFVYKQT